MVLGRGLGGVETELRRRVGHASSTRSRTTTPSEHHARSPFSARAAIRARASPRRRRARPAPPRARADVPVGDAEAARAPRRALLARARLPARHLAVRRRGAVRPVRPHRRRARLLGRVALRRVPRPPGAGARRRGVASRKRRRLGRRGRRREDDVFRGDERAPQRLEHRRHVREPAARLVSVLAPARARPGRRPFGWFDAGVARRVLP